jgi:hypothetical protein
MPFLTTELPPVTTKARHGQVFQAPDRAAAGEDGWP